MKKIIAVFFALAMVSVLLVACTGYPSEANLLLDTTVVGVWEGTSLAVPAPIAPVNIKSFLISTRISKADSAFILTVRDTSQNDSIAKDTTLILIGTWKMNAANDSILLNCNTGRIMDSTKIFHAISPNQTVNPIPLKTNIINDSEKGYIVWTLTFLDLKPFLPLLGITSAIPDNSLKLLGFGLIKTKQL
jgi:hypothetical protein